MKRNARVSIVIPVYNEEAHIAACLQAIGGQTVQPYEVIVVDNNSTDNTAAIARRFSFVRVIAAKRQGVVHARNRGFNAARGDIIARIDGDTVLTHNWVKMVQRIFEDKTAAAVSGSIHFYDISAPKLVDGVDYMIRGWMARRMQRNTFLLGSNMAIRRSAWHTVKSYACGQGHMHEDLDLALHLSEQSLEVIYEPGLLAGVSARRIDVSLPNLCAYMMLSPKTYARHNARERLYMYPLIGVVFVHYGVLRLLFRGYDSQSGQFNVRALFGPRSAARVNPATFVA